MCGVKWRRFILCYSNKTESVSLRKCPYDHGLTSKACLSAITVTNMSQSFTYNVAAKINYIDTEQNYVTVTVCIDVDRLSFLGGFSASRRKVARDDDDDSDCETVNCYSPAAARFACEFN